MANKPDAYFVEPNEALQGYDILKRDNVVKPDGTLGHEKILTIYSMEYMQAILYALNHEDSLGEEGFENFIRSSPVFEE